MNYAVVGIRLLLQFDSDDRLVGIRRWTQQEDPAPSAHECLKPLEERRLLIDEGQNGSCFGHHYDG